MTPQGTAFERAALASGLVSREQLNAAYTVLGWAGGASPALEPAAREQRLAAALVQLRVLNAWQASQLQAGRTKFNLGPYSILDSIGQGGMGQVFKGEHTVLGRVVAIKVLPHDKSTPEAIVSFNREIRAQAKLDHENLVRAYDAGEDGRVYYLVVEYVPGTDLRKLVRHHGPLTMFEAASVIAQVAAALQHAHDQGLIHRDVKPGNVLVTPEGKAKLSDLGLAEPLEADPKEPRYGRIVGTADYISPDHILEPSNPQPAWDVYSLGCTFYYAVTGKVPFPGGTTNDKVKAHLELRPLDPRRLNPELSGEFVDVLADMMAKEPRQRIASATEVVRRLKPWLTLPAPFLTRSRPGSRRPDAFEGGSAASSRARVRWGLRPAGRAEGDWGETKGSLPDLRTATAPSHESPLGTANLTDPFASATQETHPTLELRRRTARDPILLHPLVLLMLLPLSLVGLVMLVWALFQWLG